MAAVTRIDPNDINGPKVALSSQDQADVRAGIGALAATPEAVTAQIEAADAGQRARMQAVVSGGGNAGGSALGFDVYLDDVDGNDSNAGNSAASAYKTVTPINAMSSHAGLRIGVRRGTTYRQQLTLVGADVYVGAYGDGPIPLFDASDTIPTGWTKTAGRTNVWERTVTLPGTAGHSGNVWYGAAFVNQRTSIAAVDAEANTCYVTNWAAATATLYIYSATDPNGGPWAYSARSTGLWITGDRAVVEDISARRNCHQGGAMLLWGYDCVTRRIWCEDGSRHTFYAYPGWLGEDCIFRGGKNDLEAPGTSNLVVINAPVIAGRSYISRRCTFDSGGLPLVTGLQAHGADPNELFDSITVEEPRFIGLEQCIDVGSARTSVTGATVQGGNLIALIARVGGSITLQDTRAGSSCLRIVQFEADGKYVGVNNAIRITSLDVGAYRSNVATVNAAIESFGERLHVSDGTLNAQLFRVANGTVAYKDLQVGPALANPVTHVVYGGFGGGVCKAKAAQNYLPQGMTWYMGGTTYEGLAAWQAAGYDAGTLTADFVSSAAESFAAADTNLELVAGWTRVGGAANQAATRSGNLSFIGATQTLYKRSDLSSSDQWGTVTARATPASAGPFPLALRASSETNWIGLRWSATQWQVWSCIAGTLTQRATYSTVAPAIGDVATMALRGDKVWLHVNGVAVIKGVTLTATAIGANKGVGIVCRSSTLDPAADEFAAGILI